jgi:Predicted Zn-dependent protease (DUF2268)
MGNPVVDLVPATDYVLPQPHRAGRRQRTALLSLTALLAVLAGLIAPIATAETARSAPSASGQAGASVTRALTGSAQDGAADGREAGHVLSAAAQTPVPCAGLSPVAGRFKGMGLVDCLQHSSQHINGADYRIFYPTEWDPNGGWGSGYLQPAAEAVAQSAKVFGKLGLMTNVNVVFALNNEGNIGAYANGGLGFLTTDQPCVVAVFTLSAQLSIERFQQILAHELFHCFQYWNLDPQMHANYAAREWWVEGTAEYFSNVAYPTVNEEWDRIPEFDQLSSKTPLTKLSYENTVFFQFLANRISNEGIIAFLATLPTAGGTAEQEKALRRYPGFADLFQDFAQSYLDKQIADTSGAMLPVNPTIKPFEPTIVGSIKLQLLAAPFTIARFAPVFDPGDAFTITTKRSDEPGRNGARVFETTGNWSATLPETIGCSDPHTYLLAITVLEAAPEDSSTIVYDIAAADAKCQQTDACLIGSWEVTDFEAYLVAAYSATNSAIDVRYDGQSGSLNYNFGSHDVTVLAQDFEIDLGASIAGSNAEIAIILDGETTTTYRTDAPGSGSADSVPSGIKVTLQVVLDGDVVYDDEAPAFLQLIGGSFGYACDGDTLQLSVLGPSGEPLPPMTLTRQA